MKVVYQNNRGSSSPTIRNFIHFYGLQFLFLMTLAQGEIRCYCNHPSCVVTGYMCKSSAGSCFTEHFAHSKDLSRSRHGCTELLSSEKKSRCQIPGGGAAIVAAVEQASSLPLIFCCKEDMCNYINTMDINIQVQTKSNHTLLTGSYGEERRRYSYEEALQQDLWFKAAVIAVPIAGSFILILLILLAARMLRQDNKRQKQILELRRRQYQVRRFKNHGHQLLLPDPHAHCPYPSQHSSHMYRNVSLAMSHDSCCTDIMCDKNFVYDKSVEGSVLPWAKWDAIKSSTLV